MGSQSVSGDPPTLIQRACVCVCVCLFLVLQSCSTANDPAKHPNDKAHTLPADL